MSGALTKKAVAKMMGFSEQHLYRMLRNKTAYREHAEQLARYLGGTPEDYLRAARPKGRSNYDVRSYPFTRFVAAFGEEISEDVTSLSQLSDEFLRAFGEFERAYERREVPYDFESFEHFLGFMQRGKFREESQREALSIWKRFKVWRVQQECAERIYDIEVGDDVS